MIIHVEKPNKTDTLYEIPMRISHQGQDSRVRCGFRSLNFTIPHHEMWDGFYALMFITRNGGPVYGKCDATVEVYFDYPVPEATVSFFEDRARDFGLSVEVVSKRINTTFDMRTSGDLVLFGGGKDSRLLVGTLRELGRTPIIACANGSIYAKDFEDALNYEPFGSAIPNRMVPGLMIMRSIIFRLQVRGDLPWLGAAVPEDWDARWIDTIHSYAFSDVEPDLLEIYRKYAPEFDVAEINTLPQSLRAYLG